MPDDIIPDFRPEGGIIYATRAPDAEYIPHGA